jgi:hypothetical protein
LLPAPFTAVIVSASSQAARPSGSDPWDVLYVAAGLVVFILLVAALAATLNGRDLRREEREKREDKAGR